MKLQNFNQYVIISILCFGVVGSAIASDRNENSKYNTTETKIDYKDKDGNNKFASITISTRKSDDSKSDSSKKK